MTRQSPGCDGAIFPAGARPDHPLGAVAARVAIALSSDREQNCRNIAIAQVIRPNQRKSVDMNPEARDVVRTMQTAQTSFRCVFVVRTWPFGSYNVFTPREVCHAEALALVWGCSRRVAFNLCCPVPPLQVLERYYG